MSPVVLVAESDELTRLTLLYMLDALGYVASGVGDMDEMFQAMDRVVFDVVIASLTFHDPDAAVIAREAKRKQPRIKVIVASGYYPEEDLKPRIDAFVQKPFSLAQMDAAIRRLALSSRMHSMLSTNQREQYRRDGFIVLPGFKSPEEVAALRRRAEEIVDAFDPTESRAIFTTKDQERASDAWFLGSDNTVRCFFEEEAFGEDGQLRQAKALSINKIGHAMHDLDPVFDRFTRDPRLAAVARDLGLSNPQVWQSMYIFKQPGIGGEVRWHQDATFFDSDPVTVTTFWFALEDATIDNGCLWAEPGGHRGPLRERFLRDGDAVTMEKLDSTPWPIDGTAVPLEAKAGTLVCFHGLLPHYSAPNRSPVSRHAFTLHATDAGARYSPRNWIQRGADFPVRGFDPAG